MVQYLVVGGGSRDTPGRVCVCGRGLVRDTPGRWWAAMCSFGMIKSNGALRLKTRAQGATDILSFKYYSV